MGFAKIILRQSVGIVLVILGCLLGSCSNREKVAVTDEKVVFICTGPSAYAYHGNSECSLMVSRCTGAIKAVSLNTAKKMRRKPCGKCAK